MTSIIFLLHPYDPFMPEEVIPRWLIVCSSILMFLLVSVLLISQSRRWPALGQTYVVTTAAVLVASFWGVWMSLLAGGQALGWVQWLQLLAFNFVFCILGEIFLASFLLQRIADDTGMLAQSALTIRPLMAHPPSFMPALPILKGCTPRKDREAQNLSKQMLPQWLDILGEKLASDEIWHLKSQEHYVAVRLRDGRSLLLRGRLTDAIAQLPQDAGMQVHRSHWVAHAALAGLRCMRNGCRLKLHDGEEIPVARARQAEVRHWAGTLLQSA